MDLEPVMMPLAVLPKHLMQSQSVMIPVIFPHEFFAAVHAAGPGQWRTIMVGPLGDDGLRQFWRQALAEPWGQNHPSIPRDTGAMADMIPFVIHSDGAGVGKPGNDLEFHIWSCESAVASGGRMCDAFDVLMLAVMIPIAMLPTTDLKRSAHIKVAEWLAWSYACGEAGVWPELDFFGNPWPLRSHRYALRGQPLAGGKRFCFVGTKQDLKARKEKHLFDRYYRSMFCCDSCCAVIPTANAPGNLSFAAFGENALWRKTTISTEAYVAMTEKGCQSPYLKFNGFALERVMWDVMHLLYLGIAKHACANTMVICAEEGCAAI